MQGRVWYRLYGSRDWWEKWGKSALKEECITFRHERWIRCLDTSQAIYQFLIISGFKHWYSSTAYITIRGTNQYYTSFEWRIKHNLWGSPGGINTWFLLFLDPITQLQQTWKPESESEFAQSYPTLCDLMDCSLPGSSIHGILQARILEWVAFSFSRGSSRARDRTSRARDRTQASHIAGRRFNLWATREALEARGSC